MLIHVQLLILCEHKQKLHRSYLATDIVIFLVIIEEYLRLKIRRKLRAVSLKSKFTSSYKKKRIVTDMKLWFVAVMKLIYKKEP